MSAQSNKGRGNTRPRWITTGWRNCDDIYINGVIENVPRYLRCMHHECNALVTHGQVAAGSCVCGNRRLCAAQRITYWEALKLKAGCYLLTEFEAEEIKPLIRRTASIQTSSSAA